MAYDIIIGRDTTDKELFGDKMTIGYFASINLPFGTTFEGFGERHSGVASKL